MFPLPVDEARARFEYGGCVYRATQVRCDKDGNLSIDAVRLTKKGTDFKRGRCYVWLTLEHSLDRFEWGQKVAAYVREFAATVKP